MKMRFVYLNLLLLIFCCFKSYGQTHDKWSGFSLDSVKSELDGVDQKFYYYKSTKEKMPLVVALHQWSSSYSKFENSMAPQTKKKIGTTSIRTFEDQIIRRRLVEVSMFCLISTRQLIGLLRI